MVPGSPGTFFFGYARDIPDELLRVGPADDWGFKPWNDSRLWWRAWDAA
jgi:hypothetical protein